MTKHPGSSACLTFAFLLGAALAPTACSPQADPGIGRSGGSGGRDGAGGSTPVGTGGQSTSNNTGGTSASAGGAGGGSPSASGGTGGLTTGGTGGTSAGAGGAGGTSNSSPDASNASDGVPGLDGSPSSSEPGSEGDGKRIVPKPFTASPDIVRKDSVPHGARLKFVLPRGSSQRYPNAVDREINVYVPAQYVKGTPAPVLVVQDGNNFFGFPDLVSNTFDNLIAEKKLPPIVAVFANNGGGDAQGSERGKEYDTLSGVYAEWVDQELLPRVEQETASKLGAQAVTFTKDPEGRGALGGSSGGVASFIMAWYHPDLFRRVIGYSPSFVAQESPKNADHPLGAWNFHEDNNNDAGGIIAKTSPNKPIRAWLECGTSDNGAGTAQDANTQYPHYDFYFGVTRTGEKLAAKGYHVHVDVGTGAGHVDQGMVKATLPEALLWTWRGYQGGK